MNSEVDSVDLNKDNDRVLGLFRKCLGLALVVFYAFHGEIPGYDALPEALRFVLYFGMVPAAVFCLWPVLKGDCRSFFANFGDRFAWFLPRFAVFILIYLGVSAFDASVAGKESYNQEMLMTVNIFILAGEALLFAPLVEEALFRGILRSWIRPDLLFIIISGLIFGFMHVFVPGQELVQYVYILDYGFTGAFLAWLYVKTDNIFTCIMGHFCYNLIALISVIFF